MLDVIMYSIGIFMMVFGMISLIFVCLLKINTPKHREKYYIVVKLTDDNNPSSQISSVLERRNILGDCGACEIIAVNCGIQSGELDFLKNLYGKNRAVHFAEYDEITKYIKFAERK